MTTETTDKVMEKTLDKADELLTSVLSGLKDLVSKYGSDAVDLGLNVIRIEGVSQILIGLVLWMFVVFGVVLFMKMNDFRKHLLSENPKNDNFAPEFAMFVGVAISIGTGFASIFFIFNIWNWVAIFAPQLYLAHKVVEKIL